MNLPIIVKAYDAGLLATWTFADLYNARGIVQQRITDIDNEQLDYGEDDNLIQERELLDGIEAHILYLLE